MKLVLLPLAAIIGVHVADAFSLTPPVVYSRPAPSLRKGVVADNRQKRVPLSYLSMVGSFVPDKDAAENFAKVPDHPVLRDPCFLKDPTTQDTVEIRRDGALVLNYNSGGSDVFFTRPDAVFDGSKPISGGVPLCWPQFGPGEIQQHGFARNMKWDCADVKIDEAGGMKGGSFISNGARAIFELSDSKATREMWPQKFKCRYEIQLSGGSLTLEFRVTNTDVKPMSFTGALHTYFAIDDLANLKINGPFEGKKYLDKTCDPPEMKDAEGTVTIDSFTEKVFQDVAGRVEIQDGPKSVVIKSSSEWKDLAIWNPYGEENMGYKNFVCVENGVIHEPVELEADGIWSARVTITPFKNGAPAWAAGLADAE
mmetsp:Transcript_11725/g.18404  ORF Transcript_11725/g.18404 Transcript_11725/m.18404 type:complete len:368 (+) Transcript_11725:127-1230(+)|eukprot:CAMPEP_0184325698 /NCGR_PEP_ID=MMETSP1049-20130417/141694_1 /TAXON_ID=77928 /ORGANISM="Proteomonas sulcata, Strain CCMP704" /LENGTH=367 /DNA_ID=CAMNT_0026647823 /DNA_START=26 /DNA_END=1129 /DNA_ORIENTATION=+